MGNLHVCTYAYINEKYLMLKDRGSIFDLKCGLLARRDISVAERDIQSDCKMRTKPSSCTKPPLSWMNHLKQGTSALDGFSIWNVILFLPIINFYSFPASQHKHCVLREAFLNTCLQHCVIFLWRTC